MRSRTLNEKIGADRMQVTVFVGSSSLEGLKTMSEMGTGSENWEEMRYANE